MLFHIDNRATTSNITIKTWTPHSDNCLTCASVEKNKKGGRPTKKRRPGRPNSSNTYIWTREKINEFMSHVPADIFTDSFDITKLQKNNPHVKFCLCKLCKEIIRRPVLLVKCEHAFCMSCIIPSIEGKNETDVKCPHCNLNYNRNDIMPSKHLNAMLHSIKVECSKGCGEVFEIPNKIEKTIQEAECSGCNDSSSDRWKMLLFIS